MVELEVAKAEMQLKLSDTQDLSITLAATPRHERRRSIASKLSHPSSPPSLSRSSLSLSYSHTNGPPSPTPSISLTLAPSPPSNRPNVSAMSSPHPRQPDYRRGLGAELESEALAPGGDEQDDPNATSDEGAASDTIAPTVEFDLFRLSALVAKRDT